MCGVIITKSNRVQRHRPKHFKSSRKGKGIKKLKGTQMKQTYNRRKTSLQGNPAKRLRETSISLETHMSYQENSRDYGMVSANR